jgi:hypothetical protein
MGKDYGNGVLISSTNGTASTGTGRTGRALSSTSFSSSPHNFIQRDPSATSIKSLNNNQNNLLDVNNYIF